MPAMPAICSSCGNIFPSGIFIEGSSNVTMVNNVCGPCPKCHGWGKVIEGTFDVANEAIKVLSGPAATHQVLKRLASIFQEASKSNPEEVSEKLKNVPEVGGSLRQLLPTDPMVFMAFVSMMCAIISTLIALNQPPSLNEDQLAKAVQRGIEAEKKKAKELGNTQFENIGRNQPCPCESSKKYKHCCGRHDLSPAERLLRDLQNNRQSQYYETGGYRT